MSDTMNTNTKPNPADLLHIDPAQTVEQITAAIRHQIHIQLRRKGAVLGLSGGIDSAVTAALCARALGPQRVLGLLMPEQDSDPHSTRLGQLAAHSLGIETLLEDIAPILNAAGCYRRRDDAARLVVPDYGPGYKCKLILPDALSGAIYHIFWIAVEDPNGLQQRHRLPPAAYLGIVAATNMKQRTRKQLEYYHADRLNFAVAGTPNRLEYDQGFFVKNGDGAADLMPIAHLYKTQVYQLADYLRVPDEIRNRPPTTDTYSLAQTQQEFYFSLPYHKLDLCLYALNHGLSPADIAHAVALTPDQVQLIYRDIQGKRRATRYQHQHPLLVQPVPEIQNPHADHPESQPIPH